MYWLQILILLEIEHFFLLCFLENLKLSFINYVIFGTLVILVLNNSFLLYNLGKSISQCLGFLISNIHIAITLQHHRVDQVVRQHIVHSRPFTDNDTLILLLEGSRWIIRPFEQYSRVLLHSDKMWNSTKFGYNQMRSKQVQTFPYCHISENSVQNRRLSLITVSL